MRYYHKFRADRMREIFVIYRADRMRVIIANVELAE
jgi:hypothetical protein